MIKIDRMTEEQHKPAASECARANAPRTPWRNLDIVSTLSFIGASIFGLVGAANNVRHTFWNNFIEGFGRIDTPFASIRDKYRAKFQQTPLDYSAGKISADQYRLSMRQHAHDFRQEVNSKLLQEFHIPTNGIKGWTVGTVKRLRELGVNGKFHGVVGFASVTAVAIGAISLLHHNRNILDAVDDKISDLRDQLQQQTPMQR